MPLLVNSVPNLAQGVSQQPDSLRYPGQCDEQINAWATVVEGLVKRPNTNFVSKVSTSSGAGLFTHFVKRDEDNKYCVTVSLGGVGVIDLDSGNNISVATTSIATSYLSGISSPLADIRALTVADYTFLVNKKKEVKVDTNPDFLSKDIRDDNGKYNALVFVKMGDYEKTYDIILEGKEVPYGGTGHTSNKTPPGGHTYESGTSAHGVNADTEVIAEDLEIILNAYFGSDKIVAGLSMSGGSGFTPSQTRQGSTGSTVTYSFAIEQFEDDGSGNPDLDQKVGYGAGGTLIIGSNGAVQSFQVTHKGTGYDNTQTTPGTYDKPFVLTITKNTNSTFWVRPKTIRGRGRYETSTSKTVYTSFPSTPGVVMPTFSPTLPTSASYTVERRGAVLKIQADHDFSIRTEDGLANEGLGVAYKEVASITDLPKRCFNDFRVRIRGDADIDQDDYYVIFATKDREDYGEGSWVETVGWDDGPEAKRASTGIDTTIDYTTMPITLVADGYDAVTGKVTSFTLQAPNEYGNVVENNGVYYNLVEPHISDADTEPGTGADWQDYWVVTTTVSSAKAWSTNVQYVERAVGYGQRNAGDNGTNPFPSFVGSTINDVFFFKNRLGFLTDSNVIFSEADEYFNFFRTTTQQLLDSAPIDVGLSHTKVAVLQYAKAFQEKLMLFSDSSQFVLRGADVLSPKTVAISPVSEYDTTDNVEPLVLGNYIYFPFNRDKYVGMYEYYVDSNTEVFEAQEITEHVSKYIPSSVRMMAGSTTQNTVLVQSLSEQSSLYVYKYFWSGKEKIQSAWQKFTLGGTSAIRGFDFVDSTLYLLIDHNSELYLEKLILEEGYVDKGDGASLGEYFGWDSAYPILLDCNTSYFEGVTHQYDAVNNVTTLSNIPLPVSADDVTNDVIQVWSKYGRKYNFTRVDDSTITIEGQLYDYVTYNGTIYKCNLSHDSGVRDKGTHLVDNYKPDGSFGSTVWSTLTGDEAARVTTAPEWQQDVWYEGYENFVIGYTYNMLYKFSDQTLKQPTEKGGHSASNYTYQTLRTGSLNYADTGFFQVEVTPKHRDSYYYPFNSNLLGEGALVNKFTPQDGHFRFPIQAQPGQVDIEITSSSALPVKLLGAEFESMIIPRTRRYGA